MALFIALFDAYLLGVYKERPLCPVRQSYNPEENQSGDCGRTGEEKVSQYTSHLERLVGVEESPLHACRINFTVSTDKLQESICEPLQMASYSKILGISLVSYIHCQEQWCVQLKIRR